MPSLKFDLSLSKATVSINICHYVVTSGFIFVAKALLGLGLLAGEVGNLVPIKLESILRHVYQIIASLQV